MAAYLAYGGGPRQISIWAIPWTSDGSGNYSETFTGPNGILARYASDPGSAAPTDNYDITITDITGFDILNGRGADRDTANTESMTPMVTATDGTTPTGMPIAIAGPLTFAITGAGSAKTGVFYLFVR